MATEFAPKSLQQAILFFANYENCHRAVVAMRWPDGVVCCPHCGSENVAYLENVRRWKCYEKHPKAQFSLKVGTIFEDSAIGLEKWLPALWLLTNCKNGISSYELARALEVTQKTAWFMLSRLRLALQDTHSGGKLSGNVEVDESYIGGKGRHLHASKRRRLGMVRGRSMAGKVAVMGLLDRHGKDGISQVRTEILRNVRTFMATSVSMSHPTPTSTPTRSRPTKACTANTSITSSTTPKRTWYGNVHTNGCENFWSLLKRAIKGTYVSVEPFHLFRYLDEQAFRFNNRGGDDAFRFALALKGIIGKRLTYVALTGSELPQMC
jgi:transposase-like protein